MQKISLYIDTRDRRYAVRLAEYFSKYFASSMDVFLTDPEHDPAAISFRHTGPMVLLSDDPESYQGPKMDQVLLLSEQDGIDPYQSARDIAEKILTACHSRREEESRVMRAGTVQLEKQLSLLEDPRLGFGRIISFYALSGGCGLSTLMLSFALTLQATGLSVLVLTLDPVFPSYLSVSAGGSLGDLCYSLLSEGKEMLIRRIKELPGIAKNWENNIRFLPPPARADDLFDLTEEERRDLLESLRDEYNVILIDLGSRLYGPHRQILAESDRIVCLEEASEEGLFRMENLKMEMVPEEKTIRFVTENLRTEKPLRVEKETRRMLPPDQIWLPRSPELKEKGDVRKLAENSPYLEAVRKAVADTCGT